MTQANARRLLEFPANVEVKTPLDQISKGRIPPPAIEHMLNDLGQPYPEPGWINVAYSLLSQVTHSTAIGNLHMARYQDETLHANEISPEMLALTLDAACLGSAHLIGISAAFLSRGSEDILRHGHKLRQLAYKVHSEARMLHGLD